MKKTKLILLMLLSFTIFNGCSNEEPFVEENLEVIENLAYKGQELPPEEIVPAYLLIEYEIGTTQAQRAAVINAYSGLVGLLSIETCPLIGNSRTEIWTVDSSIYHCPTCWGDPKSAIIEDDPDVERAIESDNCND